MLVRQEQIYLDGAEDAKVMRTRQSLQSIYVPLRELCRKFDGYIDHLGIPAAITPPLVLPWGRNVLPEQESEATLRDESEEKLPNDAFFSLTSSVGITFRFAESSTSSTARTMVRPTEATMHGLGAPRWPRRRRRLRGTSCTLASGAPCLLCGVCCMRAPRAYTLLVHGQWTASRLAQEPGVRWFASWTWPLCSRGHTVRSPRMP